MKCIWLTKLQVTTTTMLIKVVSHLFFNVVEVFVSLAFVSLNIFCILTNHGHSTNLCPIEPTHVMKKSHWFHFFLNCYLNNTCIYYLLNVTSLLIMWFVCLQYVQNVLVLTSLVNVVIMVDYFGIINWKYPTTLRMPSSYVIIIFLCYYKVAINIRVVAILTYNCNLDLNIIIKKLLIVFVYWPISSNVQVGAQMGGPICHKSKVPIYSKSWSKFGNYN
jgi:hypothetical protein